MKFVLKAAMFLAWLTQGTGWVVADSSLSASAVPQIEEPDFSPPPVPEFMLRQPEKPLTLEEMRQQADEAARRARLKKDKPVQPSLPRHTETGE